MRERLIKQIMEFADKTCPEGVNPEEWHQTLEGTMDGLTVIDLEGILEEWEEVSTKTL